MYTTCTYLNYCIICNYMFWVTRTKVVLTKITGRRFLRPMMCICSIRETPRQGCLAESCSLLNSHKFYLQSLRVRHDWATWLSLFTFMHWRRKWQPTPVFLPGESQGGELGVLLSMGLHRVGHNWCDLAAA